VDNFFSIIKFFGKVKKMGNFEKIYLETDFLLDGEKRLVELLFEHIALSDEILVILEFDLVFKGLLLEFFDQNVDIRLLLFDFVIQGLHHFLLLFVFFNLCL